MVDTDKGEANWTEIVEQERARKKPKVRRLPSPSEIVDAACWMRGDDIANVYTWCAATRTESKLTREWCVYALRDRERFSFPEIAALFGMKGHNTVYVAWRRFVAGVEKKTRDDGLNIIRERAEYLAEVNQ